MQLNRQLAIMGVKAGTVSGVALAFLLSGTYVKIQIEVDTREPEIAVAQAIPAETILTPMQLRFR